MRIISVFSFPYLLAGVPDPLHLGDFPIICPAFYGGIPWTQNLQKKPNPKHLGITQFASAPFKTIRIIPIASRTKGKTIAWYFILRPANPT